MLSERDVKYQHTWGNLHFPATTSPTAGVSSHLLHPIFVCIIYTKNITITLSILHYYSAGVFNCRLKKLLKIFKTNSLCEYEHMLQHNLLGETANMKAEQENINYLQCYKVMIQKSLHSQEIGSRKVL